MRASPPKIENVVFDIGGVILRVDFMPPVEEFARACSVTPEQVLKTIFPSNELEKYDRGHIDPDNFFRALRDKFGIGMEPARMRALWDDIFEENEPVTRLIRFWHGRFPMYLISNTCRSHVEQFERQFDLFKLFHDRIYSCDVGLLKPDKAIFRLAIGKFGVNPKRTLYVDDKHENVESAGATGFHAVHFKSNEEFLDRIRSLGLPADTSTAAGGDRRRSGR